MEYNKKSPGIPKDREVQSVTIRGLISQEAITTLSVYAPNQNFKMYETKCMTIARGNIKTHNYIQIFIPSPPSQ